MHLDSPAGRARASPAPPGRAPGAWPPTCTGSAAARRAVCTTCACFSAGEREQTRRPHVGAGVQRPSASSLTRTLVVPGPAAVRSRGTVPPCGRSGWRARGWRYHCGRPRSHRGRPASNLPGHPRSREKHSRVADRLDALLSLLRDRRPQRTRHSSHRLRLSHLRYICCTRTRSRIRVVEVPASWIWHSSSSICTHSWRWRVADLACEIARSVCTARWV